MFYNLSLGLQDSRNLPSSSRLASKNNDIDDGYDDNDEDSDDSADDRDDNDSMSRMKLAKMLLGRGHVPIQ